MRPQPGSSTQEVLAGLVERVTYHNSENGFCVLRAKVRGHRDVVTVVGHAATIAAGEWITASGEWVNDRTHGQQLEARFLRTSPLTSADGIEKYLSSGMIRVLARFTQRSSCAPLARRCSTSSRPSASAASGRR
jgi:exodeoxyribonuclease V alpha subunit